MFGGYDPYWYSNQKLIDQQKDNQGKLSYQDSSKRIIQIKFNNKETGITTINDVRLATVIPVTSYMPTEEDVSIFTKVSTPGLIKRALNKLSGKVAVDIETKGTQAASPDCYIVGIGMADASNIFYFDFSTNSTECNNVVKDWLINYKDGLIGHNVFFDGTFLERETGHWLNWEFDTYGLYRQLATEGYPGQRWGLKEAQLQLLNWETKGDVKLDEWLVQNNYIADIKKAASSGSIRIPDYNGKGERWAKPRKSEMWRAPASILGYYCGLDVASTWQLFHEVFAPSAKDQPWEDILWWYHGIYMENVRLTSKQQMNGITIDKEKLEAYHNNLLNDIDSHFDSFINHPKVRPIADEYNQEKVEEVRAAEPPQFKKVKEKAEPTKYKKDGDISKVWLKWKEWKDNLDENGPEVSKLWVNWKENLAKAEAKEHFNPNSGPQLQWLFYDKLGFETLVRTETGKPSTGVKALPGFGELGLLLGKQKDDVKEEGYVKACLDHLYYHDDGEYRLHSQYRMPGTLTGRIAGAGGLNVQQAPKSRGYLECWRPAPGKVWIDYDFSALEQVVMTELSRDNSLYKIYGPGAKKNDIYLFNGAQLPILGEKIQAAGYNPDNPDPEVIAHVKKVCKAERGIAKQITLGSSYGMGWAKLQLTLKLQGISISEEEAREMVKGYWEIYAGVKEYEKYLVKEWKKNNGYILNGMGRPIGIAEDYIKDIVNRACQSTGHDILMLWISIYSNLFAEAGIPWDSVCLDWHDQSILECDEEHAEQIIHILENDSIRILNEQLDGEIPLKIDGGIIHTLADAKCEN